MPVDVKQPSWENPTPMFRCANPYSSVSVVPSNSSSGRWVVRSSDVRMDFFFSRTQADAFAATHNAHFSEDARFWDGLKDALAQDPKN